VSDASTRRNFRNGIFRKLARPGRTGRRSPSLVANSYVTTQLGRLKVGSGESPGNGLSMRRSPMSIPRFCFFLRWGLCFFASVATHVVLHPVSIRTFSEPFGLCADWGPMEKSMLPVLSRPR
jgi:hypothetical protein